MCGCSPGEETDDLGLKDKDDTDAGVEAAEVGGHGREGEGRASNGKVLATGWGGGVRGGEVFDGDYLVEQPIKYILA
jgi:hypothetical protein